ncbi:MAG: hypothetical protein AB1405_11035 [Bdellovibrionota bacterium]
MPQVHQISRKNGDRLDRLSGSPAGWTIPDNGGISSEKMMITLPMKVANEKNVGPLGHLDAFDGFRGFYGLPGMAKEGGHVGHLGNVGLEKNDDRLDHLGSKNEGRGLCRAPASRNVSCTRS